MRFWLLKSEPDVFSFDDLKNRPRQTEPWSGVRNYQARNLIRDEMTPGDLGFFYHSSCKAPGIPGVIRIVSAPRPDPTTLDPTSEYFDPKDRATSPRWYLVDVAWEEGFERFVPLTCLRTQPDLAEMLILRKGNRLSITPVEPHQFDVICRLGGLNPTRLQITPHPR